MKQKGNYSTIRIRTDQFADLLQIATAQQKELGTPVTVGMLVRNLIKKELQENEGRRICFDPGEATQHRG